MADIQPARRRVLFLRQGGFSHINDRVAGWLRSEFDGAQVDEVDILQDIIKPDRRTVLCGMAAAAATYPARVVRGSDLRDCFYKTTYLFQAVRQLLAEKFDSRAGDYLFSVQTQSLFDAGIDPLPHFIYTDHTHLANLNYPGARVSELASPGWIALEATIYHRARRVLVMGSHIQDSLLTQYGCDPQQVRLVGAASNMEEPAGALMNDNYRNQTILFVGIDWERKGGPQLAAAFGKVIETMPHARLIIAGCTPKLDLPNVEILGRVPLEQVSGLLLRSTVLALPSLREPQGVNSMEAMLHGIPVVASNVGALPEIVQDGRGGRIVPAGDSAALAQALLELLGDPEKCRRYGEAAREIALRQFTPRGVGKRFAEAIREALLIGNEDGEKRRNPDTTALV